jgi:ubiquinol-cytochrome c reductase cytochrome c subunit
MMQMNRIATRIATLALATVAAAAFTATAASAQTTPAAATGDQGHGKANFLKYGCYECHGTVAQGNYQGIPHLAPHPIPQNALIAYIRKPGGVMPSYSAAILPDKDAADIWAYLSSIPAGKPASAIPALAGVTTKPK